MKELQSIYKGKLHVLCQLFPLFMQLGALIRLLRLYSLNKGRSLIVLYLIDDIYDDISKMSNVYFLFHI